MNNISRMLIHEIPAADFAEAFTKNSKGVWEKISREKFKTLLEKEVEGGKSLEATEKIMEEKFNLRSSDDGYNKRQRMLTVIEAALEKRK